MIFNLYKVIIYPRFFYEVEIAFLSPKIRYFFNAAFKKLKEGIQNIESKSLQINYFTN